jgi:hypothetical protein
VISRVAQRIEEVIDVKSRSAAQVGSGRAGSSRYVHPDHLGSSNESKSQKSKKRNRELSYFEQGKKKAKNQFCPIATRQLASSVNKGVLRISL